MYTSITICSMAVIQIKGRGGGGGKDCKLVLEANWLHNVRHAKILIG